METLEELQKAWNEQADKYNQWDELGHDEIVVFAQRRAAAAERERWTEAVMAELDGNGQAQAIVAYATRA